MITILALAPLLWGLAGLVAVHVLTRTRRPEEPSVRIRTIPHDGLRPAA